MRNKITLIVFVFLVVLISGIAIHNRHPVVETSYKNAQKVAVADRPRCLVSKSQLSTSGATSTGALSLLEKTLTTQLTDVAAGTNVQAYLSTSENRKATGTQVYSGKFGTYNFEATKNSSGAWTVSKFVACKA